MKLRVIEALRLPEVLTGAKWIALPVPSIGCGQQPADFTLLQLTIGIDPERGRMYWCDGGYHSGALRPSYFKTEAALLLPQLLGECTLVDALKGAAT